MARETTGKHALLSEIVDSASSVERGPRHYSAHIIGLTALSVTLALLSSFLFTAAAQPEDEFWLTRHPDIRVQDAPELATRQGRRILWDAVDVLLTACPGISQLTRDGAQIIVSTQFSVGDMAPHASFGWDYYLLADIRILGGIRGAISYALGAGTRPGIAFVGYDSARFCTATPEQADLPFIAVPRLKLLRAYEQIELKSP